MPLDQIFQSIIKFDIDAKSFLVCTAVSLILGALVALSYMFKGNHYTSSFVITLAILPAIVQAVIMLVNGNLGTGVAVMGTFGLVRFRSIPGSAKEIGSIFLSMAIGLASGTGYIGVAVVFAVTLILIMMFYNAINFGSSKKVQKELIILIPEGLDYTGLFDDLFEKYTSENDLIKVKTTNMGSLFRLTYLVKLKDKTQEKQLIDEIRCRNGNLEISCGKVSSNRDEL